MAKTAVLAADLYTKMPKTAIPGARWDYRVHTWLSTDQVGGSNAHILALGVLPAGHRCLDIRVETQKLDTDASPAVTLSVGLLNSYWGDPLAGNYCSRLDANGVAMGNNGWDAGAAPALVSGYTVIENSTVGRNGGNMTVGVDANHTVALTWGVDAKNDRIIAAEITANANTANNGAKFAIKYVFDID